MRVFEHRPISDTLAIVGASLRLMVLGVLLLAVGCEEPFDKQAVLRQAQKATGDREFDDAIALLKEVIAREPNDVESRFRLGVVYGLTNRPFEARLELMQVIEIDSMRADVHEHLGMLAFGAEDRMEAIEKLERAVTLGSRGIQLYDTLQYLHFQEGTIEEAKKWARRAIQANPRDPRFRLKLATLSNFVGSHEDAKEVLEPLLRDYPDYWDALLLAGKVYRQLGEHGKALAALNQAGEKEKGHPDYAHELGMVRLKTGDARGAVEAFDEVIRYNPEKAEAHYGLGQSYMKLGERVKAKAALTRFREMQQNDKVLKGKQAKFVSNWQEGLAKNRDGDFEGAYASYQEALKFKQGDVSIQVLIWLLRRRQGNEAESARAYRTVERLIKAQGRQFSEVTFTLSERLIKKGFDAAAVSVLLELLLREPDNKAARYQLIRAYSRLGKRKEREEQLEIFRTGNYPAPIKIETGEARESAATSFEAGYLGAEACAECHKDKYEGFRETAHHRTSATALGGTILGSFAQGDNSLEARSQALRFEMTQEGDSFYQTAHSRDPSGAERSRKERFDFVIGSGKLGQMYLYWDKDRLYQLPISYMTASDKWINSPGYRDGVANFSRPIAPRCLECHTTYFGVDSYTTNVYDKENYLLRISCERCHGPGSKHYRNQIEGEESETKGGPYIVSPAKLTPERSLEICAQCHSGSGVEAFGKPFSHRPGADIRRHYKLKDMATQNQLGVHATNQIARLSESKCFRESESMTCVSCHDPHQQERGNLKLFSERCMKCHETMEVCGVSDHMGAGIADNCVDCHLPQMHDLNMGLDAAQGFQFQEMRDHNIGIYPDVSSRVSERIGKPLQLLHDGE